MPCSTCGYQLYQLMFGYKTQTPCNNWLGFPNILMVSLLLGKPRFNWDVSDRCVKLLNFQLEVTNILETRAHEINDEVRILVIKNWLGQEGLLFMETFIQEEKEKSKTTKGLFRVLNKRSKMCHNHIILALQYQKQHRKSHESA